MPISNGDQMPEDSLKMMTDSVVKETADLFNGRKVVFSKCLVRSRRPAPTSTCRATSKTMAFKTKAGLKSLSHGLK